MKKTETSGQTWPPPPAVENPLAAHDALLAALVRRPSPQPPTTRLHLARRLHRKTRLGLRHCRVVVQDFCERHDILSHEESIWTRLPIGLAWAASVVVPIYFLAYLAYFWMHAHATGLAARLAVDHMFDHFEKHVLHPWLDMSVVLAAVAAAFALPLQVRLRREATDARRKLTVDDR